MAILNTPDFARPVPINDGGTGQSTNAAAFDALSPLTTQGDLLTHTGSSNTRFPLSATVGQYLTAGSTGVVWDKADSVVLFGGGATGTGHSPAASTQYYMSASFGFNPSTADATAGISFPDGRITKAWVTVSVFGTAGSTHRAVFSLRKNSTSDATISSNVTYLAGNNLQSNTSMNYALTAGDRFYVKIQTPAWTTLPTIAFYAVTLVLSKP